MSVKKLKKIPDYENDRHNLKMMEFENAARYSLVLCAFFINRKQIQHYITTAIFKF